MSSAADSLRLVWIDLEMTGLNPAADAILEIAAIVTGADLLPIVEIERVLRAPEEMLERMSNRVRKMHTDNGLLAEVDRSMVSRADAERAVLSEIARHCPPGEGLLCGNSIHHDHRFLQRHMPRLEQHLHHRQIDIGTISVLVQAWYPHVEFARPRSNHRALGDIRASLEELRYYCKHAFGLDLTRLARARAV